MNKYANASDFTSIFIPRVFANITKERITHIVENVVPLGGVERIDIVEIDEKTNRVWIHFTHWYDTEFVNEFKKLLMDETKQAKIVYDDPWFWIVLKNTHRIANGQPKIRIDLEEPAPPATSSPPKSTVTFTTSQKRNYGKYRQWADVESSDDESTCSTIPSSNNTRPPSPPCPPPYPPCPPPYPNPYYIQPVPYPMMYYPPAHIPYFTQQYNQFPIAPSLPIQYHPVASWNGVPIDATPSYLEFDDMGGIEDDAFLTENDYLEILSDLEDGELYDDEDLYNMYLIEKEELALINQEDVDENDSDLFFGYSDVYVTSGTGFDEETILFHDQYDAPLSSDVKVEPVSQPEKSSSSPLSRSFDKITRPIISFKNKISSSPTFTRPLQTFASSYKDMLMVKGKV
jgi:hypothetical protein